MSTLQASHTGTAWTATGPTGRTPLHWGRVWVVAALGLLVCGFLWLKPYERSLVGYEDGSRQLVESSCPVPIAAALTGSSDRSLSAAGDWLAGEAPCMRSARFRVALGGLVLLLAAGSAMLLWGRASRAAERRR